MSVARFNPSSLTGPVAPPKANDAPGTKFLLPGQLQVATAPARFSTILGSCVTLCLWDRKRRIGGMNHVLLPDGSAEAPNKYRYANIANKALLEQMIAAGCRLDDMVAGIYGGATIYGFDADSTNSIGTKNIAAVLDFLKSTGIPVASQETGGRHGRKIMFDLQSGATTVEEL
jgi:chemotaxis protein CheD